MSQNKSKTSLLALDKKMSPSQNVLKNKSRFAKTESIDPRKTMVTDITDISITFDSKLDEVVSDVSDVPDVHEATEAKLEIID